MFKYVYHIECGKTSTTYRTFERTWFTKYNLEANEVINGIREILAEVEQEWYYDSYLTTFTITRELISTHNWFGKEFGLSWQEKEIFKWVNPRWI